MKKFREISEQYREEGRHKLIQPKNKAVVSPRPKNDSADVKLGEAVKDKFDIGEYDQEGDMAKSDLRSILANAKRVHDMLEDSDNLPEWVQSKITKAEDYMSTVANYMEAEMNEEWSKTGKEAKHVETGEKTYEYREVDNEGKPTGKREYRNAQGKSMGEEVELEEENKPTNPELWSRAVSMAKSKFDVYPSAYANGWAAKWYKSKGGGWKSVSEEVVEEGSAYDRINARFKKLSGKSLEDTAKQHKAESERLGKEIKDQEEKNKKMKSEAVKDDLPFTPDKPKKQSVIPGKYGIGYSTAKSLAKKALQKQMQKMKKPMKEEMTKKAKIVKNAMKKTSKEDEFQAEPMISQSIVKNN